MAVDFAPSFRHLETTATSTSHKGAALCILTIFLSFFLFFDALAYVWRSVNARALIVLVLQVVLADAGAQAQPEAGVAGQLILYIGHPRS